MKSIYDYENNINIIKTTYGGDVVITMNREILIKLINDLHDASEQQKAEGFEATSRDTKRLWAAMCDKELQSKGEQ